MLHLERIGRHDNFFELGGDSILTLQIVSHARGMGVAVTAAQLFERQTIAQLARALTTEGTSAQTGAATAIPLTDTQQWILSHPSPFDARWFRERSVAFAAPVDGTLLQKALRELVGSHDSLRLQFDRENDNGHAHGELISATLDPSDPDHKTVRLIAHALIADHESMRILAEDLHTLYSRLLPGESSTSAAAQRVVQVVARTSCSRARRLQRLPVSASKYERSVTLGETQSALLLADRAAGWHTSWATLVLAALTRAWCHWSGEERLDLSLHADGREHADDSNDYSRTVGCLGVVLRLSVLPLADTRELLDDIKAQLRRAVPHLEAPWTLPNGLEIHADLRNERLALMGTSDTETCPGTPAGWADAAAPRGARLPDR